jgi:hypothetical protein
MLPTFRMSFSGDFSRGILTFQVPFIVYAIQTDSVGSFTTRIII